MLGRVSKKSPGPIPPPGLDRAFDAVSGSASEADEQVDAPSAPRPVDGCRDAGFLAGAVETTESLIDDRFQSTRDSAHNAGHP